MVNLKAKVVLITGSSIGIGREAALKFAKEECKIGITYYKDEEDAKEVAKKCMAIGASDTLVNQLNVMETRSITNAVNRIIERFGEISILVNNSGIVVEKHLADQSFEEIEIQVRTNLEGLIKMTKECLPHVKDTIINLSSGAGLEGYEDLTTYCATKFGVRGFTQALSKELAQVKVYTMYPPVTATRMNNFQGVPPEAVAEVIVNIVKGKYKVKSGGDIKFWEVSHQYTN